MLTELYGDKFHLEGINYEELNATYLHWLADSIHFGKNDRKRELKYPLHFDGRHPFIFAGDEDFMKLFKDGTLDMDPYFSMADIYPLKINSPETVKEVLKLITDKKKFNLIPNFVLQFLLIGS